MLVFIKENLGPGKLLTPLQKLSGFTALAKCGENSAKLDWPVKKNMIKTALQPVRHKRPNRPDSAMV